MVSKLFELQEHFSIETFVAKWTQFERTGSIGNITDAYLKYIRGLKKIGPKNFGSRVRDNISCVFLPQTIGANSVHLRHETTNRVTA